MPGPRPTTFVGLAVAALLIGLIVYSTGRWHASAGPGQPGDVNCDGVANSLDASLILQFASGLTASLPCEADGDVTGDGLIDPVDAALVLQFAAGLVDSLSPRAPTPTRVAPAPTRPPPTDAPPSQTPTVPAPPAEPQACLAPSEPPANPVDSEELVYNCNDCREEGAEPEALDEFVAFYTRLPDTDLAQDPRRESVHPISGGLADVVVNIPDLGRVEFPRRTSYRPVWVPIGGTNAALPELVSRAGDGDPDRPDRLNRYSYARVVKSDLSEIIVHWRYVTDFCDPTPTGVVHELFAIRPDGTVTRTVHIGANTLEQAAGLGRNLSQELALNASGVVAEEASNVSRPLPAGTGEATVAQVHPIAGPVLDFALDDGTSPLARTAAEAVSGAAGNVSGRFPNWAPGVSGTALAFDGYTTEVSYPAASSPTLNASFTLEAWVSLAAYPFGTVQVAGQATTDGNEAFTPDPFADPMDPVGVYESIDPETGLGLMSPVSAGGKGYLLAIDAFGLPHLLGSFGGTWTDATATDRLPLHEWHHIGGVYDAASGELRLYVDGTEVASQAVDGSLQQATSQDFVIGLNREPQWNVSGSEMHIEAFRRSLFGVEGLIDEVRLYDRALSASAMRQAASRAGAAGAPVLARRVLPDVSGAGFTAHQETLSYHPLWDQLFHDSGYDDVVVSFESLPTSIVFWKGMTYGPAWVSGNAIWASDQSMEYGDSQGLVEHMGDKQVRYAHARVVEETDARIVVHWRYAPVAVSYRLYETAGELAWVDEYYTIYPDGTTVRFVDDWFCSQEGGAPAGWQGTYILTPPGAEWTEVYNEVAVSVLTSDGTRGDLNVVEPTDPEAFLSDAAVIWTNTKSTYRLYRGVTSGVALEYNDDLLEDWAPYTPEVPEDFFFSVSPLGLGNHWPVAQAPNDGRGALFNDRLSASEGLVALGDLSSAQKSMLYGFSESPEAALPMVNGWNDPPGVSNSSLTSEGYDRREHAYRFIGTERTLSFTLSGSRAIQNPGVVVRGWTGSTSPTVTVDGSPVAARTGIHFNGGERTLIVWLPLDATTARVVIE